MPLHGVAVADDVFQVGLRHADEVVVSAPVDGHLLKSLLTYRTHKPVVGLGHALAIQLLGTLAGATSDLKPRASRLVIARVGSFVSSSVFGKSHLGRRHLANRVVDGVDLSQLVHLVTDCDIVLLENTIVCSLDDLRAILYNSFL